MVLVKHFDDGFLGHRPSRAPSPKAAERKPPGVRII
jgi:hypothetical protein